MATKTIQQSSEESLEVSSSDAALDEAIDGLRGVLKKDSDGDLPDFDADTFGAETSTDLSTFGDFGDDNSGPAFDDGDFGGVSAAPAAPGSALTANLDLIMDIPIDVQIVLGSSRMQVSGLMNLTEGAIIALDKKIGEPVEITVNGRKIGRGEITVLEHDDTRFGIKLTEIYNTKKS
ncbi:MULTISPECIES: flagellar motor switch protein FliN [unclassified Rhizobium]|uniref:flagellar motor switch protein FliN n=1 Tax=unclassified Rhizobium TaxID=2613769 RepID=UPI000EA86367|nr:MULTISPECIES: flagellar motor switch protein FliN [unclassified Rhizobium]AYG65192.1 flagellar motor switch protein FliN [Rhizobium sp. CCGE531]AYG71676.1 flagellar motor switch protein FliN [Rhizobium sp. CCGE532]